MNKAAGDSDPIHRAIGALIVALGSVVNRDVCVGVAVRAAQLAPPCGFVRSALGLLAQGTRIDDRCLRKALRLLRLCLGEPPSQ